MEFRILNAYRDGDMKAHRREAHNTALIECVQVAAEKAKWKLSEKAKRASSRKGGGGERAAIPPTAREAAPAARPLAPQRTSYDRAPAPAPTPPPSLRGGAAPAGRELARRGAVLVGVREEAVITRHCEQSEATQGLRHAAPGLLRRSAPRMTVGAHLFILANARIQDATKSLRIGPTSLLTNCFSLSAGASCRKVLNPRFRGDDRRPLMTKLRGRGMASINYPIGMNLGGDPSQALVHSNPSGKFTVSLSSIDLGQGMKSVTRQICAETLGVPVEDVYVDTANSDTGPHCMGSFASRGTHRVGNAVMAAAREARGVMMEAAAEELEVNVADLETDGRGNIHVKGAPHRSISTKDVAIAAQFRQGRTISGRGIFLVPLSAVDPETGEMSPATCYAHACLVAEVEVDDETGEVSMVRMDSAYELGRALNPRLVEQQLVGGAWMGVSHALFETPEPYYPDISHGPRDFTEYLMPGPGDICPHDVAVLERPAADGPFGAKGPGEMCANPVLPAVANAIFNAVGVRVDDLPITPEKVLRAIRAQGRRQAAGEAVMVGVEQRGWPRTPSPLAGGGGRAQRGRMRGIERSEMALWCARNFQTYDGAKRLPVMKPRELIVRSHLAPLDPPHPPRFAQLLPPQGGKE